MTLISEKIKPRNREELFIHLYKKAFPGVAKLIHKYGGSFDDAKDIFQDALIIYFEKQIKEDFSPEVNEQAYLTGIAKHLWSKKEKENVLKRPFDSHLDHDHLIPEEAVVSKKLIRFIELSGKKCLELLNAFYYDKLNMKELAAKFGFLGERSATVQKYKCLEKVREAIRSRSLNKEDFYE